MAQRYVWLEGAGCTDAQRDSNTSQVPSKNGVTNPGHMATTLTCFALWTFHAPFPPAIKRGSCHSNVRCKWRQQTCPTLRDNT